MEKRRGNRRGQVTIFIIIAVIIVAVAAILYFIFPQVGIFFGVSTNNPNIFMQNCLQDKIKNVIENISLQGGSLNPDNFILYNNAKVEYLCYINENYKQCVMQQPFLKAYMESEITNAIKNDASDCFDSLVSSFQRQGYAVNLQKGDLTTGILPGRTVVNFNNALTITKSETQNFDKMNIVINNNLYELVLTAESILNWEARYGDAETTMFMGYYHDLKVEKKLQDDGSTVYILTNRNTGEKFQFASRSVALPSGIGANGVVV
jgi:hypothetical protein